MYTRFFGFDEKPFTLTPNPRFIFLGRSHKEAFAHLLYGIDNHYGFIALTGEVGTGKTTVLRTMLGQLDTERYRIALIFNPCLSFDELLFRIIQEFGIKHRSTCTNDLIGVLNNFLITENHQGRTVVLVIDEAQNLKSTVLENLRLLSNLETENEKLIQIILAGQPELESLLHRPELRQLDQRIAVRCRLKPLDRHETREYIQHRMSIAGASGGAVWNNLAATCVHACTHGVPRLINILCDRILLMAYGSSRRKITPVTVFKTFCELRGFSHKMSYVASVTVFTLLFAGVAMTGYNLLGGKAGTTKGVRYAISSALARRNQDKFPDSTSNPATTSDQLILQQLSGQELKASNIQVFNAVMKRWNSPGIRNYRGGFSKPDSFINLAAKRGLHCFAYNGKLDDVIHFNLPFIAVTNVRNNGGQYCVAILAASQNKLTVSPTLRDNGVLSKEQFAGIANGMYYIFWRNVSRMPLKTTPGEKRTGLKYMQLLLGKAGFLPGSANGIFDLATISALNSFQKSQGIPETETINELTLALLTKFDPANPVPMLDNI